MVNYDRLNAGIVSWSNDTGNELRQSIIEQGIRHSDKSKSPKAAAESLKVRTPKEPEGSPGYLIQSPGT